MNTSTLWSEIPSNRITIRRLRYRRVLETAYDLFAWTCGLLAAGWVVHDVAGGAVTLSTAVGALPAVWALAAGSGLAAGLYRGRYQRGSFDEVLAVTAAALGTGVVLILATAVLLPGQRESMRTV